MPLDDALHGLIDVEPPTAWLDEHVPSIGGGPLRVMSIHGGTSNVILSLKRSEGEVILRRPPRLGQRRLQGGALLLRRNRPGHRLDGLLLYSDKIQGWMYS